MAIVRLLKPHVGRVVIAHPLQVRVIAEAKAKTDRIDAAALARLHAAGYLPEVWQPDERTELLRNLVSRRATIVQGMTRTKNRIHAVLHANLIPPFSGKLFMGPGRKWLADQPLAEHERSAVNRWLVALDAMEKELTAAEAAIASACLGDDRVRRLMTIGGINMAVAAGILSAIGDVSRFAAAEKLVSYLGLDPRVRQSGDLMAMKERQMQLKAGAKSRRGRNTPGKARDYSIKELREKERALVEQAEKAYTRFVSAWSEKPNPGNARASNGRTKTNTR